MKMKLNHWFKKILLTTIVIGGTGAMLAGVTISNTSCTSEHKYNTTIDTSFLEAPLKTTAVLSTTDNQKSINDVSYSYEGPENYIEIKNNIIELHQFSTPQTNISYKILTIIDSKTVCETPLTVCPTNQQIVSNSGDTLSQNNLTITLTSFVNEEQLASSWTIDPLLEQNTLIHHTNIYEVDSVTFTLTKNRNIDTADYEISSNWGGHFTLHVEQFTTEFDYFIRSNNGVNTLTQTTNNLRLEFFSRDIASPSAETLVAGDWTELTPMPSYVQFVGRTTNTSHCDIRLNVGIPVPDNVSFTIKATAPSSNEATITIFVEKYSLPHTYQISSNTGTHVIPIGDSSTPSLRVTFYVDATPFTTSWHFTSPTTLPNWLVVSDDQGSPYVITDSDQKNTPRNTPSTYLDFRVDINAIPTTGIDDFSFSILTSTAPNLSFELEVVKYHPDLYIASSDNNNILRETHDLTLTFYEKNDGFPTAQNTVWDTSPFHSSLPIKCYQSNGTTSYNWTDTLQTIVIKLDTSIFRQNDISFFVQATFNGEIYKFDAFIPRSDTNLPIFNTYNPSMNVGESQTLSASISIGGVPTSCNEIYVSGTGENTNWSFDPVSHVLTYIASLENIIRLSAFAKYGSIQSQTIFIDLLVPSPYHALPTTNDFFIRNSAGYIEGYSTSFITACNNDENLNTYLTAHGADLNANILDLSNDKVSGKQFALSPKLPGQSNIANFYSRIKRIYLDNTTFGWNGIGAICNSGYYSFSTDDYINRLNCFSNLEAIYMRGSNFCDNQNIVIGQYTNISSACQTFANLLLPALKTIVIDNTIFACSNMVDNLSTDTNDIVLNTADSTFINCQMQALTSLEIDHCIFATENMAVTSTPKVINTAISTLGSCVLDNLDSLTISNNIYAARNMGNCELSTAVGTFANCSSNNLTSLSLNNECFSVMHMIPDGSNGTLDTAKITFANCLFPNLKTVDLSTSVFAATGAGTHYLLDRYAYMTFVNTNFDSSGQSVGVSDLYLPQNPKQPDGLGDVVSIYSWNQTFIGCGRECFSLTIHGYEECPPWFNNTWFGGPDWSKE